MATFAVFLDGEKMDAVKKRLAEIYPNHYDYHNNKQVVLVRADKVAGQIADDLGITGEKKIEGATGAVIKLNAAYAGLTKNDLWDWLQKDD